MWGRRSSSVFGWNQWFRVTNLEGAQLDPPGIRSTLRSEPLLRLLEPEGRLLEAVLLLYYVFTTCLLHVTTLLLLVLLLVLRVPEVRDTEPSQVK